jgi:hypothetical protein
MTDGCITCIIPGRLRSLTPFVDQMEATTDDETEDSSDVEDKEEIPIASSLANELRVKLPTKFLK